MCGRAPSLAIFVLEVQPSRRDEPSVAAFSNPSKTSVVTAGLRHACMASSSAACRSGGGRFGNSLPRGNCGRTPSLAICVLEVYPVTDRQPIAGFSTMQNIGRGSYTLTRMHGWRMLTVTRFPGDLSQGHALEPYEKTAAATGVLHDRPQSTVCRRCQTETHRLLRRRAACLLRADPTTGPFKPQRNHRSQQVRPLRVRRNGGARQRQMSVTAADGSRCSWL